jgi:serine O-acetyltransferase
MVDIHPAAVIGRRLFIDHAMGVVIGETAIVGDDVTIYQQVTLGGVELVVTKRHPTIEDGVVIGAGAKVLGNITIGKNAKIGANSVVVRDVPAESTAVGIPARITGVEGGKFDHHKLPDIEKEMFAYLIRRIKILEDSLVSCKTGFDEKDKELDTVFEELIKTMQK